MAKVDFLRTLLDTIKIAFLYINFQKSSNEYSVKKQSIRLKKKKKLIVDKYYEVNLKQMLNIFIYLTKEFKNIFCRIKEKILNMTKKIPTFHMLLK